MLRNLKRQNWRNWFTTPIPMIGDVSPIEAAQTSSGREKLEELFSFYSSHSGGAMDINIPPRFARWKLGFGPGSASEFSEEEAILSSSSEDLGLKRTQRTRKSQKRLERSKGAIFVPKRCEVVGCDKKGDDARKCSGCGLVSYCSREHQKSDWARHKLDCNHLKNSGLKRLYFTPEEELQKYPTGCFPLSNASHLDDPKCFVCGATKDEVNIGYTECCGAPICDNEHEYQLMSYSRDFCMRSHMRYTLCGNHFHSDHSGDWRQCDECKTIGEEGARSWYSTNGFNLTPCLESDMPKGSFITVGCSTCDGRITPGHDAVTISAKGQQCHNCCP